MNGGGPSLQMLGYIICVETWEIKQNYWLFYIQDANITHLKSNKSVNLFCCYIRITLYSDKCGI